MRATARLVARADRHGRTTLAELRGESPLLLRQVPAGDGGVTVYVVGGAAGPLAGDDLRLDVEVGPGARVRMHTVAASIALPGRPGAVSRMLVRATVAERAALHWLPEQLVAAAGCAHVADAEVDVAEDGVLHWRDELICGRHGEQPGRAEVNTGVDLAGRPLLRQSLAVGPDAPGWAGPAVLGGAPATGSLLVVDPARPTEPPAVRGTVARLPLTGGTATLWTATAPDAHTLRTLLESEREQLLAAPDSIAVPVDGEGTEVVRVGGGRRGATDRVDRSGRRLGGGARPVRQTAS
ncbi:urease accessory protein UreD [Micromonospora radicis]|uniref:Urease accessory protein UreD n=1 Tax=Micromonospora radicis TaxID=1894971 RepID=A0A418N0Y7_9ACTN|nr:urease accessory protein UreD [Micromonospora radicis]RIV41470.1 urease accessory protein UreD [Micromonospora radicis]